MSVLKTKIIIIILPILLFGLFGLGKKVLAADYYVSQAGSGIKNGTSFENAWPGWPAINWDTDGEGSDKGVGEDDTLYVIGTVRATTYPVNGHGLSEEHRLKVASFPGDPGKLWQGLEITENGWIGPDAHGAYSKSVAMGTTYGSAVEWETDPWSSSVKLVSMAGAPDDSWNNSSGLYYCVPGNSPQTVYYKPASGSPSGKTITAWTSTSRVFQVYQKDYITISGLVLNNPILLYNSTNHSIIENCEISCTATQTGILVGYGHGEPGCSYGIIRGNYVHDCGNGLYFVNQGYDDTNNHNYWIVENNYIANIHGTKDSHGIGIQGGTGNIFQYNHIYNAGSGLTFWNQSLALSGNDQTMQNNIVRFNKVNRIGYYGSGNGNGRGIEFSGETGNSDLTTGNLVYGNVVSDCTAEGDPDGVGIRIKNGIPSAGGYSIKVFNNTVADCNWNFVMMPSNYENYEVGAYLRNNISLNPKTGGEHVRVYTIGATFDLDINKNIYYPDGKFYYDGIFCNDFAAWKAASGEDSGSFTADPDLNTSLIPQANGSGIDAGEDLSSLADPVFLHPSAVWPVGAASGGRVALSPAHGQPDIGAYEYQGENDTISPIAPDGLNVR